MRSPVKNIHYTLKKDNLTLAIAESCTGGLLSKLLTDEPGSSSYFLLGIVTYSNAAKADILGISASAIKKHGAVSEEIAQAMAHAARLKAGADCGIGITGIAGPQGGTPGKPVGTVFIAAEYNHRTVCQKFRFPGPRSSVRTQAAHAALTILNRMLEQSSRS